MDDRYEPMDELDALIESALRDEPFLKAPISLHRGVELRLRVAALREHEQARFSVSMASLCVFFLGALITAGVTLWFSNLSFLYSEGVSGGMGHLDFYAASWFMSFANYQGAYSLVMSVTLTVGALALAAALQLHKMLHTE